MSATSNAPKTEANRINDAASDCWQSTDYSGTSYVRHESKQIPLLAWVFNAKKKPTKNLADGRRAANAEEKQPLRDVEMQNSSQIDIVMETTHESIASPQIPVGSKDHHRKTSSGEVNNNMFYFSTDSSDNDDELTITGFGEGVEEIDYGRAGSFVAQHFRKHRGRPSHDPTAQASHFRSKSCPPDERLSREPLLRRRSFGEVSSASSTGRVISRPMPRSISTHSFVPGFHRRAATDPRAMQKFTLSRDSHTAGSAYYIFSLVERLNMHWNDEQHINSIESAERRFASLCSDAVMDVEQLIEVYEQFDRSYASLNPMYHARVAKKSELYRQRKAMYKKYMAHHEDAPIYAPLPAPSGVLGFARNCLVDRIIKRFCCFPYCSRE